MLRTLFSLGFLFSVVFAYGQVPVTNDSGYKTISAGAEYQRSSFHQTLWGANRRVEWTTPVRVPILLLDTAFGGLHPYQKGGGNETKSLRLKTKDGKEYQLRSINKSRDEVVLPEYRGTFIESLINDGVSMSYPYGAFAIADMQRAAGIHHAEPQLVYIPSQPALDSFDRKFGNDLYLIEQRPDGDWSDADHLGNFKKFKSTANVTEKLLEDNRNKADQHLFARVRLFDMLINDWDRHEDNFRWGVRDSADFNIYEPIPRDRDQAFYTYNGWLIGLVMKNTGLGFMQNFDTKIKDVKTLNTEEKDFDRFFTNGLSLDDWLNEAKYLQQTLTDAVIESSVKGLPSEIFNVSGKELIEKLIARRNDLQQYAAAYYKFIALEVEVPGSERNDVFEVNADNDRTTVTVFADQVPVYNRTFNADTKEIRLFGIKGNDVFRINGVAPHHLLRIIGGPDKDSLIKNNAGNVHVYDDKNNVFLMQDVRYHLSDDSSVHKYNYENYNYSSKHIVPYIFFNKDDLWYAGVNYSFLNHRWRRDPYASKGTIGLNYYGTRRAISASVSLLYPNMVGRWTGAVFAEYDALKWTNYFGTGNETVQTSAKRAYNRLRSKDWQIGFGLSRKAGRNGFTLKALVNRQEVINDTTGFVGKTIQNEKAFRPYHYAGLRFNYTYLNINDSVVPTKGITLTAGTGIMRNLTQDDFFQDYSAKLQCYVPLSSKFSFAFRVGSQIISNSDATAENAQITQYAVIGGPSNIRGYRAERFWGKSSFYNNNELRFITNFRSYWMNAKAGLFAFFDNGRVWMPNEHSSTMHTSYGGGLILAPFNKINFNLSYGVSKENALWQLTVNTLF